MLTVNSCTSVGNHEAGYFAVGEASVLNLTECISRGNGEGSTAASGRLTASRVDVRGVPCKIVSLCVPLPATAVTAEVLTCTILFSLESAGVLVAHVATCHPCSACHCAFPKPWVQLYMCCAPSFALACREAILLCPFWALLRYRSVAQAPALAQNIRASCGRTALAAISRLAGVRPGAAICSC